MDLRRRQVVALAPALVAAGPLAGCSDQGDESDDGETGEPETTEGEAAADPATATATESETTAGPLSIGRVELAAEEPQGYRDYEAVEDATFGAEEVVWLYVEPDGVATEAAGAGEKRFSLTGTYSVADPGGTEVDSEEQSFEREVPESRDLDELFLFFFFTPESPTTAGEYEWTVELRDEISGERASATKRFTIETGTDFVSQFRDPIESELDVGIVDLEVADGVVDFEYETDDPLDSEDGWYQIGFVAGRYARAVDQGWETEQLRAVVTDGNGDRYRWHLTARTAREWMADELTDEEFVGQIQETIEQL